MSTVIHMVTEDIGVSTPPTFISCSSPVKSPGSQHICDHSNLWQLAVIKLSLDKLIISETALSVTLQHPFMR